MFEVGQGLGHLDRPCCIEVGFEADQELWPSSDTICDDGHNHQRDLVVVLDQMCSYEAQVAKDMLNFALQLVIRDCKGMVVIVLRIVFYSARNSGGHVVCDLHLP